MSMAIIILLFLNTLSADTINFVGDMMFGRRYYCTGANSYHSNNQTLEDSLCYMPEDMCDGFGELGIIPNCGNEILLNGVVGYLTQDPDVLNIGNLEAVITEDTSTPHPGYDDCKIVFHSCPSIIEPALAPVFDFLNLGNNHVLDYMETGIINTQELLGQNNISFGGAGLNDTTACGPSMIYHNGIPIAFLGSSDINGEDLGDECEPSLTAGPESPGLCGLTEENISSQISEVLTISDSLLVIYQMHTGYEYSFEPERGTISSFEYEYYNPFYTEPSERSIAMAHHTIDEGASIVIQHHPHVLQGLEFYNGKLIAHSLGNFVFDQNFSETFPSIILNAEYDETGFFGYQIVPIYLHYYLPQIATGNLANYIFDHMAMKSRKLNTYIKVDRENHIGEVVFDAPYFSYSTDLEVNFQPDSIVQFISDPIQLNKLHHVVNLQSNDESMFRVGRETIWMGDFDFNPEIDDCVNRNTYYWSLHSSEVIDTVSYNGTSSVRMVRDSENGDNALVDNYYCFPLSGGAGEITMRGFIKTENAEDAMIGVRFYSSRCSGTIETKYTEPVNGTNPWTEYHRNLTVPEDAKYIDVRMVSFPPDTGQSIVYFDNVGVVQWEEWHEGNTEILYPNDYYYYQVRSSLDSVNITLDELSYFASDIDLSHNYLLFDTTNVGDYSSQFLTITNSGNTELIVHSVYTDSSVFQPVDTNFTIGINNSFTFEIFFNPTAGGFASDTLYISSNDNDESFIMVPLSGFGYQPPAVNISVDYSIDWNLVGLPLGVEDATCNILFPEAIEGTLYRFDNEYISELYLTPGEGYWLRFTAEGSTIINGFSINELNMNLTEGWNLFSGLSEDVSIFAVVDPDSIIVPETLFGFNEGYVETDILVPGNGYWVRAFEEGEITLTSGALAKTSPRDFSIKGKANSLTVNGMDLYFGIEMSARERLSYSLPPKPPVGAFDVRFKGGWKLVNDFGEVEVMSTSETLTISYDIKVEAGEQMHWILTSKNGEAYTLEGLDEITIPSAERFILERNLEIPRTFSLHQNYPNPFNPITTLRYDLPQQAQVILTIYDLLGREVFQLVNTSQKAGFKSVRWDATDSFGKPVSAGMYLYQIQAGAFVQTRKMVLLK